MSKTLRAIAFLSVILVVVHFGAPHALAQRTIAVVGEATASQAPETLTLSLTITTQDVTASTVFAKHGVALERLKQALIDAGLRSSDITEGMLALNPTYDYSQPNQPPRLVGYHLMTPVEVRLANTNDLPHFLDVATQAGASNVSITGFGLKKKDQLRDQATALALTDARERAAQLAKLIGVSVGDIVSVSDMEAEAPGRAEMEHPGPMGPRALEKSVELKVVFSVK